jgi:hypothetical protein
MSGTATMDAPALIALREVLTAYDDGGFAAQTISAARARVVAHDRQREELEASGAAVIRLV